MGITDPQIITIFADSELRLATYYTNLRDKIAALNIAVLGFTFTIFDKIQNFELIYFVFLVGLGLFSYAASIRAGISYNYHFRNYETVIKKFDSEHLNFTSILDASRNTYETEKSQYAKFTFWTTYIASHAFWSIFIGSICPIVAVVAFWPW